MYLSESQVIDLLATLAVASAPGSRLAINFGVGLEQRDTRRGRLGRATMACSGERFRFRLPPDDATAFLSRSGWEIDTQLDGPALRDRYLTGTTLGGSPITDSAFVARARRSERTKARAPSATRQSQADCRSSRGPATRALRLEA